MSGTNYWGDLGDEVADKLLQEQKDLVDDKEFKTKAEERRVLGLEKSGLFSRLEFKWKTGDKLILDRIRVACGVVTQHQYAALQKAIDELYSSIRIPVLSEHGLPAIDDHGRQMWQKDESGKLIEDWSRLDGADLEVAIFNLQRNRIELATRTNELLQEAIFAKHIFDDEYQDGFSSLVEGTQGDRKAQATRTTTEEKYFAFYRYCLFSASETLLKEIIGLQRVIERIRDWKLRAEWNKK